MTRFPGFPLKYNPDLAKYIIPTGASIDASVPLFRCQFGSIRQTRHIGSHRSLLLRTIVALLLNLDHYRAPHQNNIEIGSTEPKQFSRDRIGSYNVYQVLHIATYSW